MQKTLTALFVGLGSIGTRHLNNLTALAAQRGIALQADALRSDLSRPLREGVAEKLSHQFTSLETAPCDCYDIAFITNPTSLHAEVLAQLKGKVNTFFIEKPIFDGTQTALVLEDVIAPSQKAYVAAPMRWCGVMIALKEYLANNPEQTPYSVRAISSSYLPAWRPGVDYRNVYSAHKELGGGVTLDLIHEWDYLVDLFGKPLAMHHFKGQYSQLEIDSDDVSIYIAQYPKMLCELHLDYFGRTSQRSLVLFTKDGTIIADFIAGTLTLPDGSVQQYIEEVNERYLRELSYFLDYAAGPEAESCNSPATAQDVLRLTLGFGL